MARLAVRRRWEGRARVRVHAAEHRASPRACDSLPNQYTGGRVRRVGPPPEGRGVPLPGLAVRIREILENVRLAQESLSPNAVASAQVLANVANLLNIRDTELSSFLVAMGDISLRKTDIEEKRDTVKNESEVLLDYTRKALARLTYLKKTLQKLDDEVATCEAQMHHWKANLAIMVLKERQYKQQYSNYKALLNRVG